MRKDTLSLMNTAFGTWITGWQPKESRLTYYKLVWITKSVTENTSWFLAVAEALQIHSLDNLRQLANREITEYVGGPNSSIQAIPEGVLLRSSVLWNAWTQRYSK
jgi:hypothetical protein